MSFTRKTIFIFVLPLIGGIGLIWAFTAYLYSSRSEMYKSLYQGEECRILFAQQEVNSANLVNCHDKAMYLHFSGYLAFSQDMLQTLCNFGLTRSCGTLRDFDNLWEKTGFSYSRRDINKLENECFKGVKPFNIRSCSYLLQYANLFDDKKTVQYLQNYLSFKQTQNIDHNLSSLDLKVNPREKKICVKLKGNCIDEKLTFQNIEENINLYEAECIDGNHKLCSALNLIRNFNTFYPNSKKEDLKFQAAFFVRDFVVMNNINNNWTVNFRLWLNQNVFNILFTIIFILFILLFSFVSKKISNAKEADKKIEEIQNKLNRL